MSRGNVLGMMWCGTRAYISEGNPDFNMFNGGDTVVDNPISGFYGCETSDGPYNGMNDGLYQGFVYSTFCTTFGAEYGEYGFGKCMTNNQGKKDILFH